MPFQCVQKTRRMRGKNPLAEISLNEKKPPLFLFRKSAHATLNFFFLPKFSEGVLLKI